MSNRYVMFSGLVTRPVAPWRSESQTLLGRRGWSLRRTGAAFTSVHVHLHVQGFSLGRWIRLYIKGVWHVGITSFLEVCSKITCGFSNFENFTFLKKFPGWFYHGFYHHFPQGPSTVSPRSPSPRHFFRWCTWQKILRSLSRPGLWMTWRMSWCFYMFGICLKCYSPPVRWGLLDFMWAVLPPSHLLLPLPRRPLRQMSPDAKRDLQSAVGNAGPQ